jgi:hypothetical protein
VSEAKHTPGPWRAGFQDEMSRSVEMNVRAEGVDGQPWVAICRCNFGGIDIEANARLIAAAPDLLASWEPDRDVTGPDFLDWVADRLVRVYGEPADVDFVLKLRRMAEMGRAALAKVEGPHADPF